MAAGLLPFVAVLARAAENAATSPVAAEGDAVQPFSHERLIARTRELAQRSYEAPAEVPEALASLSFDAYGRIRFRPEEALWRDLPSYHLHFYFPGSVYHVPVRINVVENGTARQVPLDPAMFDLGGLELGEPLDPNLGFAGFRVAYPLHEPERFEDLLMFRGASYFRAVGRGTIYGLSARGLALNTGLGRPEEFPVFREFWVQRPAQPFDPLTIFALLDGPSVAGAYRFDVVAREHTQMDVDVNLFFREDVEQLGVAPLTSMFFFGPNDRVGVDDYRPRVHDSEGLLIWTGGGEVLWRPLVNPASLRMSVFGDENPRGFGLVQRTRDFDFYQDLRARYDLRPNLWVQPKGTWGKGSVRLIEIPSPDERHDNIVAFWTPETPVAAKQELRFAYSLLWSLAGPLDTGLAPAMATRVGSAREPQARRYVIDFVRPNGAEIPSGEVEVVARVEALNGKLGPVTTMINPMADGWRVTFAVEPSGTGPVELRCVLVAGDVPISETWLYRQDGN